jgi:hypothetical protein
MPYPAGVGGGSVARFDGVVPSRVKYIGVGLNPSVAGSSVSAAAIRTMASRHSSPAYDKEDDE